MQSLVTAIKFRGGQSDTAAGFNPRLSGFTCQYHFTNAPHASHLYNDIAKKTNGRNLETITHQFSFGHEGAIDREVLFLSVKLYLENTDNTLTARLI